MTSVEAEVAIKKQQVETDIAYDNIIIVWLQEVDI